VLPPSLRTAFASLPQAFVSTLPLAKELPMATMSPHLSTERRHIPDRRSSSAVSRPRMKALEWIPLLLLIIGGINWGLVGLFNIDLVATLFGDGTPLSRLVYVLVGLSGLYSLYLGSRMSSNRV
jgi:uncharacterized membrane protein YuzA (DUF378 family)